MKRTIQQINFERIGRTLNSSYFQSTHRNAPMDSRRQKFLYSSVYMNDSVKTKNKKPIFYFEDYSVVDDFIKILNNEVYLGIRLAELKKRNFSQYCGTIKSTSSFYVVFDTYNGDKKVELNSYTLSFLNKNKKLKKICVTPNGYKFIYDENFLYIFVNISETASILRFRSNFDDNNVKPNVAEAVKFLTGNFD